MNKMTYLFLVFFLCLISRILIASSVIIVNLCEKESFIVAKVGNKKEKERYKLFSYMQKKQEKEPKKSIVDKKRDNACLKHGIMVLDVDFKNGEDVWIKGNSWRILPKKAHYKALGLKEREKENDYKNDNYILFIDSAKKGIFYGGSFKMRIEKFSSKKEDFGEKIKKIYTSIIPRVVFFDTLKVEKVKNLNELKAFLGELEKFKKILVSLGDVKKYYGALKKKVFELYDKVLIFSSDKKFEKERDSWGEKKVKNKKISGQLRLKEVLQNIDAQQIPRAKKELLDKEEVQEVLKQKKEEEETTQVMKRLIEGQEKLKDSFEEIEKIILKEDENNEKI